ncbi:MAG TPA: hypothetical protein ENI31_03870 [Candidatus Omnitrophica bacterium]|nr:hypothetical protein [Candidatus Omnitrophota bacterium]
MAFLVSTPTTGIDSILATYSLLGPLFALFRPLAAIISGVFLGWLDYLLGGKKEKQVLISEHSHFKTKFNFKVKEVFRYGFYEVSQDIGKWLILGVVIGGVISVFLPKDFFSSYFPYPLDFLASLIIGVPLYVCATGSIPVAVSLMVKGFSPGAGLVFLIAGPATNAITLSFVRAKFKRRSFYLYLVSIILIALILGVIFNFIWYSFKENPDLLTPGAKGLPYPVKAVSGTVLFLVVVNSLFRKTSSFEPDYTIEVPDIHCQSCKLTLEGRLSKLKGIERVSVDVGGKIVKLKGEINKEKILKAIKEAGYNSQEDYE